MKFFDKNILRTGDFIDKHIEDTQNWYDKFPPFAHLEISACGNCNRECFFCPYGNPNFPRSNESLSISLFESLLVSLKNISFSGRISFSGFSEPLLNKDIEILIQKAREYCPGSAIEMVTNGDLLTEKKMTKLFDVGLNNLRISLYDGPEQIKKFTSMMNKCNLNDRQVILRPRYLTEEESFGITLSNRAGAVELNNLGIKSLKEPLKQQCNYPFYKLLIDYNGEVYLCPNDWNRELSVGNLLKNTILEIWNSKKLKGIRKKLIKKNRNFSPCATCDVDGTLNANLHFEGWKDYYNG